MAIAQQLSIDTTNTALDLANEMFGSGIQVLSATFNGSADATSIQAGIYSGALTTIPGISPTDTGVILSTGNVQSFAPYTDGTTDTNRAAGTTTDTNGIDGDAQLNALAGANTFDAAIFQADFIPDANFITLQFVFSSEEYLEYVSGGFNDAFGVWVNGVYAPVTPLAGGTAAIDTINLTQNANLFLNNPANTDPFNSEMDGLTRVLTVKAPVNAGQANTIKIAIADAGDAQYDSNVLIMANSIQTMAIAVQDNVNMLASSTRTIDVLSNDTDSTDGGLTITHINGTAVVPGGSVTLPSGEVVTLNADKTLTIQTNAGTGASVFTYSVLDSAGNTDVGFVNLTVVSTLTPDGIVHGTTGGDLIQTGYLGDPDGDRVDNNDALGVGGTTGDGDYVLAMGGNDTVLSGAGNDIIYGGSGNDSVIAGAGNDYVSLGDGNDTFGSWSADNGGNDTIDGDAGNDSIVGGSGNDIVYGGAGDDILSGQHGLDTLFGGAGGDTFLITDDHEGDVIDGGDGVDQIAFGNFLTAAGITVTATGNDSGTYAFDATPGGFTQAQGSYSNVEALGLTNHADTYNGAAATGDITVDGGSGNDTMTGGASNDALYGGGDNDILVSGGGADTLSGGFGADRLVYNAPFANGTAIGGVDYDILDLSTYPNAVSVAFTGEGQGTVTDLVTGAVLTFSEIEEMILTPQSDVVDATPDNGYTYIQTRDGNDLITGSAGDDIYDDEIGAPNGQGNDTFYGAGGNDTLWMGNDDDLAFGGTGNDQLGGEAGNDTLHGDDGNDTVAGFTGNDVLYGGAGDDSVTGDEANDTLYGGSGADSLYGGEGDDSLDTGSGNDLAYGGDGNDTITGSASGTHTLYGDAGDDVIAPGAGGGLVYGGTGNDLLTGSGLGSQLQLMGDEGNDTIFGGLGADALDGGADADVIHGAAGDTVMGGESVTTGTDSDTLVLNWADVESITYGGGNNESGTVTFTAASGGGTLRFWQIETIAYTGVVDGTSGDDVMNIGFTDAQGDIIDGADGDVDTIFGYGGNDSINAGADTDLVYGGTGNDTVVGGGGNDTILGEDGADSLFGNDGNDSISGGDGADYVDGDEGSDRLSGDAGNDTLVGDDGNDTLSGGTGDDQVYASGGDNIASGDAGADQVFMGTGADTLYGGAGNDVMGGGGGNDLAYGDRITFVPGEHASATGGAATSFSFQNNSTQTVTLYWIDTSGALVSYGDFAPGTSGVLGTFTGHNWVIYDTATGAPLEYLGNPADGATVTHVDGNDFLSGDAGNDTLYGEAGNDALYGGDDADRLFGGAGDDTLGGDAGNDSLEGGDGNDSLIGGLGADTLLGGAGDDTLEGGDGDDEIFAGDGADLIDAGDGNDYVLGEGGADTIYGGAGNDTLLSRADSDLVYGGDGNDSMLGLTGNDTFFGGADADTLFGGADDDLLAGDDGNDSIFGDDGNDQLQGGAGLDSLHGGIGNDTLDGGDDADELFGDAGSDSILGGAGADTAYGGADADTLAGGGDDDLLFGGDAGDLVQGDGGDDVLWGDMGADTLEGGAGNDTLIGGDATGFDPAADLIYGGAGNDLVEAGAGADTVDGGDGNDTIRGEAGADSLSGGADRDLFVMATGGGTDTIAGGEAGDDFDTIDTTAVLSAVEVRFTGDEAGEFGDTGGTVGAVFTEIEALQLGAGNDTVDAAATTSGITVDAGAGDDLITGGSGADTLTGGLGGDTITGGAGNDVIDVGAGDGAEDFVVLTDGAGNDTITGFAAPIDNGDGTFTALDLLDVTALTDAGGYPVNVADVTVSDDGSGNAVLRFPNGESITLLGVSPAAVASPAALQAMGIPAVGPVDGAAGDDAMGPGHVDAEGDQIDGSDGVNDTIFGNAGNDAIVAGVGDDLVYGGTGRDTLSGGVGNDTIDGGADVDLIQIGVNEGTDSVTGGSAGTDLDYLEFTGTADGLSVTLTGNEAGTWTWGTGTGSFADIEALTGSGGADLFDAQATTGGAGIAGGAGNDTLLGGSGGDNLSGGLGDDSIVGGLGKDTLNGDSGNDTLDGGDGDDILLANTGNDLVFGGDGNDYISAIDGLNQFSGGAGNDTLIGGADQDTLSGGIGNDSMRGQADRDTFVLEDSFGQDTIIGGEAGLDSDTLDASAVTGDVVVTYLGNEAGTIVAGIDSATFSEIEFVQTGSGDDTIDASGTTSGVVVTSTGDGDDVLIGGSGDDVFGTGSGADTVTGGAGNDTYDLGAGDGAADVVVFGDGDGSDTVQGFEAPIDNGDGTFTGIDTLDVSGLTDANGAPVNTDDVTVSDDGLGNAVLTFPNGESITLEGVPVSAVSSPAQLAAMGIPVPDYVVEGTTGDDLIDGGYLGDPEGDMVDAGDDAAGTDDDVIEAGDGNDTVYAGSGNDTVNGGTGDDLVDGGLGDDQLFGGAGTGTDTIYGGAGNDTITDYLGDDVIFGGAGDDLVYGGGDADEIHGDDGNDDLRGSTGSDTLHGGTGNDSLYGGSDNDQLFGGDGDDLIHTGPGNDTAFGGQGSDTLILDDDHGTNVLAGGEDAGDTDLDVIDASAHSGDATVVFTGDEAGTITAGTDSATFVEIEAVQTGSGNDTIDASATTGGVTVLSSGDGDDLLIGGSGDDVFATGSGADTVDGGAGDDTYELGAGDGAADVVVFGDGDGADTVQGFEAPIDNGDGTFTGADLLDVSGMTDANGAPVNTDDVTVADDGQGNTVLTFPNGESLLLEGVTPPAGGVEAWLAAMGIPLPDYVVEGTAGNDTIDGGYLGDPEGDMVDAGDNAAGADDDVIGAGAGDDLVLAGAGNDTVYGGDGADTLEGGADNDSLEGGAGADSILGGDGNDTVRAGNGDDTVIGGAGDDSLFGFTGNDSVSGGDGNDYINTRAEPGVGVPDRGYPGFYAGDTDAANDLDTVDGGMGNDTILTGDDNDYVLGGAGDDSIDGGFDDDTLQGQAGHDTILGNEGRDFIEGGAGSDLIYGGLTLGEADALNLTDDVDLVPDNNMDTLFGGDGNDTIYGMDDADELYGGSGNDLLDGGIDDDSVFGDSGADMLVGGQGDDVLDGGSGDDSVSGGAGNDTLTGGDAADTASSLPPEWSVLSGTSGSLTGTNGNGGFTQTTTSSTGGVFENTMTVALPGGGSETLSGYQVGNGTPAQETHVHDFSQQVAGAQLRLAGINQAESVAIWLDGGRLDLNQAIADGIVSFDPGTGTPWQINEAGEVAAAYDEFGVVQPAVLIINVPFQTLEVQNISPSGLGNGSLYELSVNTNPALVTEPGGNDTLDGGEGDDLIDGGEGADSLLGGTGDDTVSGGIGDDTIGGGAGQDTILVADDGGADSIQGGEGGPVDYDTLDLSAVTTATTVTYTGAEAGSLTHGTGSAGFAEIERLQLGSGDDTVNAATNAGPVSVGGGAGVDTLVLDGQAINVADVTFDDTVSGTFTPANGGAPIAFGPSEALQLSDILATYKNGTLAVQGADLSGTLGDVTFDSFEAAQFNVVCFVRGTRIKTDMGEVSIEDLQPGDRVLTLDNGYQPIRWIGSSQRQAVGALAPIRIAAGALGNERDLLVSPQHRMLLRGWQASLMFGEAEVLVAAKALVNDRTIRVQEGGTVEYFHMLFDRHEIVFAEGAASESFHPGQQGWKALDEGTRVEILDLFPELADGGFDGYGPAARLSLKDYEGRILAEALLPRA